MDPGRRRESTAGSDTELGIQTMRKGTCGTADVGTCRPGTGSRVTTIDTSAPKTRKRSGKGGGAGRRSVLPRDIPPSPEAACESQSEGLSDCTLHAD